MQAPHFAGQVLLSRLNSAEGAIGIIAKIAPIGQRNWQKKSFLGAHSDHDQKQQHNPHLVGGARKSAGGKHGKHIPGAHALKLAVPAGKDRYKKHQKPDIFHLLQNTDGFFLNIRDGLFMKNLLADKHSQLIQCIPKGNQMRRHIRRNAVRTGRLPPAARQSHPKRNSS